MAVNPLNTTSLATPNTLASMQDGGVEDALKIRAINKKLEMESLLDDIFETLGENVVSTGQEISVPNAIFMKLEAVPTGARQVTIPLLMALTGAPFVGAGTPVGSENKQNLKYSTFHYQEYSYAVASTAWGINYNDMSVYGVFEKIQPQISTYMKEFRGQRIREALLLTHDSVLTTASIGSAILTPHWNKNWFIANTDLGGQPVYDADKTETAGATTFSDNIDAALTAASTGVDGVDANANMNYFLSLEYYAKNYLRLDSIKVGGKDTYVALLPSSQVQILKRDNPGQLGEIYTSMVRKNEDVMEYTGAIGRIGSILLIEDQRNPTLGQTATPDGVLTPNFVKPGNSDGRNKAVWSATNRAWDIGFLLGKAAVCEWTVRELHFETETQNYGYNKGTGAFGESGISIVEYDAVDGWDGTANNRENYGSAVLAWTAPAITA